MPADSLDPRVAAVQRVAKNHDTVPRVREVRGGDAEIVSARRGRIYRHRVDGAGQAVLVETVGRTAGWCVGRALLVVGVAIFVLSFLAWPLGLVQEDDWLRGAWFLSGVVVIWVGLGVRTSAIQGSLNGYGAEDGWAEVNLLVKLSTETPPLAWLSVAQLPGVDRLTVERGNESVVRNCGRDGVEVVTDHRQVLECHLIDRRGAMTLVDSCCLPRHTVFHSLKTKARRRYGGRRGDWFEIDLRPTD